MTTIQHPPVQLSFDSPKLCECGCGLPAPISPYTDPKRGYVMGAARRFISGHYKTAPKRLDPQKFWAQVDIGAPDACWEWQGIRNHSNYGTLWVVHEDGQKGRKQGAHRTAWELTRGPIPVGMFVIHKVCDNPPCCNPAHLALGTHQENMDDMWSKGRGASGDLHGLRKHPDCVPKGERSYLSKLTEQGVRSIRKLHAEGIGCRRLARQFGVCPQTVTAILQGRTWKHVK